MIEDQVSPVPSPPTLARISPVFVVCVLTVIGLMISPFFESAQDVYGCWLNWARITDGTRPWNLYLAPVDVFNRPLDCNYPPVVLYLLTGVQCLLNLFSLPQFGRAAVTLVKLPGIISLLLGVWVCRSGLTRIDGAKKASMTAVLYALCLPIWFNANVWGQWDAVLCLAMLCTIVAGLRDQPLSCGMALGWALTIKFQAVILVPAVSVYSLRHWSFAQAAKLVLAAISTWFIIALPFLIAGAGHGVFNAYFGAVNHYPLLSVCACNVWMVVQTFNQTARTWSFPFGFSDRHLWLGIASQKQIGLIIFGAYTLFLMYRLSRRINRENFVLACGMTAFAFFMLPTQMHERYILPACAIFALTTTRAGLQLFFTISLSAAMNQIVALVYENQVAYNTLSSSHQSLFQIIFLIISIANIALFLIASTHFFNQTAR